MCEEVKELYKFIQEASKYAITREIGMGVSVPIGANMVDIYKLADRREIDADSIQEHIERFILDQAKIEYKGN